MVFCRQWLLILSLLLLGGGSVFASSSREERAYAAAVAAFHDGIYDRAEQAFAQFVDRYRKSGHVIEAVLLEAQAQFKQGKFTEAIALLSAPPGNLGSYADRYAYWLGELEFARGDFSAAAKTFSALPKKFPDSVFCLTATVEAAAAFERLGDWPRLTALLGETNGVLAQAAELNGTNQLVSRGRLLLAQAQLAQENYTGAGATLKLLNPSALTPDLDWQRANLLCRVQAGAGDLEAALVTATNLLQLARTQDAGRLADSVAWHGTVLERMDRWAAAGSAWSENLTNTVPEEWQRQAILKMAEAAVDQNKFAEASAALEEFLKRFPDSPVAPLALLTLGEFNLRQFTLSPADTNQLSAALGRFDQLLLATNNTSVMEMAGKAYLDRGWGHWLAGNTNDSLTDFTAAVARLPRSEDLAVAEFKMADAQFALKDFSGARKNYAAVLVEFGGWPQVMQSLGDRALYQLIRASLELKDNAGAEQAMHQLLDEFPKSELADNGQLLLGEGLADSDSPTNAVAVLRDFQQRFPDSSLLPQVELALAQTFERALDWPSAVAGYEHWLTDFSTNTLRPQVEYALGYADFQAGNETNALARFSGFVTRFPTNELAPRAQWWVADHYFRLGGNNFSEAEKNYELIFQTPAWKNSPLFYPAQLMAGRAAAGRLGFTDAARYFTGMTADTNCPTPLATQAMFAYGSVLMRMDSPDTNRPFANFELATNIFMQLALANPTNELGALASSELGDCSLQLGAFDLATNAYTQVMNSPDASAGLRCRAQIGLGRVLEKKAEAASTDARKALLDQARNNYLDAFETGYGNGLRDNESADAFWVKKAGLQALPLLSAGGNYPDKFFERMESLLPPLKDMLEKKRAALNN